MLPNALLLSNTTSGECEEAVVVALRRRAWPGVIVAFAFEFWFGVVGFDLELELGVLVFDPVERCELPHPSSDPSRGVTGNLPLDESPIELAGEPLYPFPFAWWAGENGLGLATTEGEGELRFTSGEGGMPFSA